MSEAPPTTPVWVSSKPPLTSGELSIMEQGKSSPLASTALDTVIPPSTVHKIFAEFVATYILVFCGCGAILVNDRFDSSLTLVGIAVVWGLVAMAMVYTIGHVSGAHFNPAVTIALASSRRLPLKQALGYVVAQIVGGILASYALKALFSSDVSVMCTLPPKNNLRGVAWEFIITFNLMFVVCGVATDDRAINELAGVGVGAVVLLNVLLAGKITGASMNPARSIGPALVAAKYHGIWIYIAAPILGALAATMVYSLLRVSQSSARQSVKNV